MVVCMKKFTPYLISLLAATAASAQVIMINFGSTTVPGGQATFNPLNTEVPSFLGSTWNEAGNGNLGTLQLADGSAATGVSMEIGSSTAGSTVNFSSPPQSSNTLTGSSINDFYKDTVTMASVTWNGGMATNDRYVGIRVDGLDAGEYTIYQWGRNGNIVTNPMNAYAGAGATAGTFNFASIGPEQIANTDTADDWIDTVTYAKQTVTIATGESIYIGMNGVLAEQSRGFLSGVQIVGANIPEPGVYAALLGVVALGSVIRRRRR